jgi:ribonuclease P protein component
VQTLRRDRDFDVVFRLGRSYVSPELVLYVHRRSGSGGRVGFCVSKKLGKAVVRNRTRRRLREIYRKHSQELDPRCDVVLLARKGAVEASFQRLEQVFLGLARKARLLAEPVSSSS